MSSVDSMGTRILRREGILCRNAAHEGMKKAFCAAGKWRHGQYHPDDGELRLIFILNGKAQIA